MPMPDAVHRFEVLAARRVPPRRVIATIRLYAMLMLMRVMPSV